MEAKVTKQSTSLEGLSDPYYFKLSLRLGDKILPDSLFVHLEDTLALGWSRLETEFKKNDKRRDCRLYQAVMVGTGASFVMSPDYKYVGAVCEWPTRNIVGFLFVEKEPLTDDEA